MTGVRPLTPDDLPAAAGLFAPLAGTGSTVEGVQELFRRLLFEDPWRDPELPALAYEDDSGRVVGFFSRCVRRMRLGDERIRLGCGMHFAVAPDARGSAAPLLAARLLGGPQDLMFSDGANPGTQRLWEGLRGMRMPLESLEWTRVLRPAAYWQDRATRRLRPGAAALRRVAATLDRALAGAMEGDDALDDEPLTPEAMVGYMHELMGWATLRPDYDVPFLRWLFEQVRDTPSYGELSARLVRRDGAPIGWHISLVRDGGAADTLQVVARPADAPAVFDAYLAHAFRLGAVAARGRLEAHLCDAVTARRAILRQGNASLLRTRRPELLVAALGGRALLTRLDGNGWIDTRGR